MSNNKRIGSRSAPALRPIPAGAFSLLKGTLLAGIVASVAFAQPFSVTPINISPSSALPAATVNIAASGFTGTIIPANVVVTLTGPGGPLNVTASNVQLGPGTERIISFVVPNPGVPLPASYQVGVSGSNTGAQTFTSTGTLSFTINPLGSLVSVTPPSGLRGQTINNVQLVGSLTNWVAGQTTVSFGPDITVSNVSITDATHASVTVAIGAGAALGVRSVSVTSQGRTATKSDGFTVAQPLDFTVTLINVSPPASRPGLTIAVSATGFTGTINPGNVTVTLTGLGGPFNLPASNVQLGPGTERIVSFVVPNPAVVLPATYQVTLSGSNAGGQAFTSANSLPFTINPQGTLVSVTPAIGQRGSTLNNVQLVGSFTNWVAGQTTISFGPDFTVSNISVTDTTHASVTISIGGGAALGPRAVSVTSQGQTAASDAFTVQSGTPSITLNPASAPQGTTLNVTVSGTNTNFTAGSGVQFSGGITTGAVTLNTAQSLTVSVTIPAGETLGAHTVTVTTGAEVINGVFTVTPAPARTISLNPGTGQQGATLNVTVTGTNTNFAQGTTVMSVGAGITINSVSVSSATSLSVNLSIANNAPLGSRDVTVTTGAEIIPAAGAFAVTPGPRSITVAPPSGVQGQTLSVTITGTNTNFTAGTQVAFNPATGITVNSITFISTTSLTANLTISSTAAIGARDVTVTTGPEAVTGVGAFSIGSSGPELLSLTPDIYRQGETVTATITGRNTTFTSGQVQVSLGPGVTAQSVSVVNTTTLTVQFVIASNATLGTRTLTVISGGQTLSLSDAATITSADTTARLISVAPNSAVRGQTLSITITGENTHFVQGSTQVNLGPGITVSGVNVTSATVLTAQIAIANDAEPGFRTATVTTGSEVAALASAFQVLTGSGSQQPFTCNANAGVPPLVRAEGLTELIGDILIVCTGGVQGEQRTTNVQVFLNANITSRLIGSASDTEALLIVDELGTPPGSVGATPAVYRGQRTALENAVVWPGIVVTAPGNGQRILRIMNVRANASQIGAATTLIPNQITAFLSASPSQSLPINNPQQTVAYVLPGLAFDIRNCLGTAALTNTTLAQCIGVNSSGNRNLLQGTTGEMQFSVRFQEGFQTAFKPQIQTGQIPSVPGTVYNSESGFVRATTELPYQIGGADSGTRLVAKFLNVPAGVRLFVTTGPSFGSSGSVNAVLVQAGPNGEGGTLPQSQTPFAVPSTGTLNCLGAIGPAQAAAEIAIVNGTGTAVWEITAADAGVLESATFGVAVAYIPDLQNRAPAVGQITAAGNFAPFYAAEAAGRASAILPVPRFADRPTVINAFSIESCVTHLLFPFVTNQQGFDTGIAIANTSSDAFANPSRRQQSGICTVNYFGQTMAGGPAPASQRTNAPIAAGSTLTFILSSGGNYGLAGTPGFQGYIFAQCEFQYAHGFAFITDGPIGAAHVAEGYLALIVAGATNRGPAVGETLSH